MDKLNEIREILIGAGYTVSEIGRRGFDPGGVGFDFYVPYITREGESKTLWCIIELYNGKITASHSREIVTAMYRMFELLGDRV